MPQLDTVSLWCAARIRRSYEACGAVRRFARPAVLGHAGFPTLCQASFAVPARHRTRYFIERTGGNATCKHCDANCIATHVA